MSFEEELLKEMNTYKPIPPNWFIFKEVIDKHLKKAIDKMMKDCYASYQLIGTTDDVGEFTISGDKKSIIKYLKKELKLWALKNIEKRDKACKQIYKALEDFEMGVCINLLECIKIDIIINGGSVTVDGKLGVFKKWIKKD